MLRPYLLAFALVALVACTRRREPSVLPDAGQHDAGPAQPTEPHTFQIRQQLPDGGFASWDLALAERREIQATQQLEVSTRFLLQNYRIRVFDELDRAMVSNDVAAEGDGGIQYQITFLEPLKAAHRYALVIDPQTGPRMTDSHGTEVADQRFEFQIAGKREKELPAKSATHKKKHRRHRE